MSKKTLRVCACFFVFATAAFASVTDKPSEVQGVIKADKPFSTANYHLFVVNVYDAALWTDGGWSWDRPFALALTYNLDASRSKIVNRSIDEMDGNKDSGPLDDATKEKYRGLLNKLIPNVADGQRLSAVYIPGKSITFYLEGKATGSSHDMKFAKDFLGIWLSPGTTDPDFRAELLHKS